jgi:hypothetical protein
METIMSGSRNHSELFNNDPVYLYHWIYTVVSRLSGAVYERAGYRKPKVVFSRKG